VSASAVTTSQVRFELAGDSLIAWLEPGVGFERREFHAGTCGGAEQDGAVPEAIAAAWTAAQNAIVVGQAMDRRLGASRGRRRRP
jgi:hypothetical protein